MGWWSKAFFFIYIFFSQNKIKKKLKKKKSQKLFHTFVIYTRPFHVSGRGKRIQTCLCVCPNNMLEYMARAWVRK